MKLTRIICWLCMVCVLAGCKEQLYSNLSEKEANEIVGALLDKGIEADKAAGEEKTWTVMIEHVDFARAAAVLRQSNFPREPTSGLGDVFKKQGLISSPTEERARLIYALSEEMAATLSRIDGVVLARVHVALLSPDSITGQQRPASVSVFIKHRIDIDMQRFVPRIKTLVVNGIEGANYDNVSVGLFPTDPRFEEHSMGMPKQESAALKHLLVAPVIAPLAALLLLTVLLLLLGRERLLALLRGARTLTRKNPKQ
ncbi:MAG: type III secretion inner membrane ring lipoprotein SctJ [Pseudomonadota bacterium]